MIQDKDRLLKYAELVALFNKLKAKIALKGEKTDLDSVTTGLASLVEALAAEVQRATAAENTKANSADVYTKTATNNLLALKADLTALQSEATTRGNEDTRLAGLIGANSTAITDATTTLQAAITAAINTCKSYTDSQVVGSTKWMGVCTYANLPTNPNKGEFWTITDQRNAEYIWTGSEWANIGADVDFTAILQDIANNATAIANETTRAKAAEATLQSNIDNKADASSVYTKTQSDARFQPIGSYLTEIADGSITTAKLASSAVTTAKLADGSVTTAKLADTAVTTAKIKDANVTNAKLAVDAVGTSNIKDGNVTESKLASALATTINGKADDSGVVHLTGAETISSRKTFSKGLALAYGGINSDYNWSSNIAYVQWVTSTSDGGRGLIFQQLATSSNMMTWGFVNASDSGWTDVAVISESMSNSANAITSGSNTIPTGHAIYAWANPLISAKAASTQSRWRWVDVGDLTAKRGIYYSTGAEGDSGGGYSVTDYIAVTASTSIRVKMALVNTSSTGWGIAFYNSSKTYISGVMCATGSAIAMAEQAFTTPANTAYMRFTVAPNYATLGYPYVFVAETTSVSDYIAEDSEVGYVTEQMIDDLFADW